MTEARDVPGNSTDAARAVWPRHDTGIDEQSTVLRIGNPPVIDEGRHPNRGKRVGEILVDGQGHLLEAVGIGESLGPHAESLNLGGQFAVGGKKSGPRLSEAI